MARKLRKQLTEQEERQARALWVANTFKRLLVEFLWRVCKKTGHRILPGEFIVEAWFSEGAQGLVVHLGNVFRVENVSIRITGGAGVPPHDVARFLCTPDPDADTKPAKQGRPKKMAARRRS